MLAGNRNELAYSNKQFLSFLHRDSLYFQNPKTCGVKLFQNCAQVFKRQAQPMLRYRNIVSNLWAALKALKAHVHHILIFHVFGPGSTTPALLSEVHCHFSFIIHCSKKLLLNCTDPIGPQITLLRERHGKFRRIMVQEHCVQCSQHLP